MARPVDPVRREARRLQVIDAALTRFAADGYHATTTAAICREAGIGSGTLFHHFPTKASILVAILEHGTAETRAHLAARAGSTDPRVVLLGWVDHAAADLADPRAAGFVQAVAGASSEPGVAEALAAEAAVVHAGLEPWAALAADQGVVRRDLPPRRVVGWLVALVDAYAALVATGADARAEAEVLHAQVASFLAPGGDHA